MYSFVMNTTEQQKKLARELTEASNRGDADATHRLGVMCIHGCIDEPSRGIHLLHNAFASGHIEAGKSLAFALLEENKDRVTALEVAQELGAKGELDMQLFAAELLRDSDTKQAFELAENAASNGYAPANTFIGDLYSQGRGVEKNIKAALKWYQKGVDAGDTGAEGKASYARTALEKAAPFAALQDSKGFKIAAEQGAPSHKPAVSIGLS